MLVKLIQLPCADPDGLTLYDNYLVQETDDVYYTIIDDLGEYHDVKKKYFSTITDGATKYDDGKDRWDLYTWLAAEQVVKVLTFGAQKYSPNGWRKVEPHRYEAALHRHLAAYRKGEKLDSDSGLPHLAHALCCLSFLMELEAEHDKG